MNADELRSLSNDSGKCTLPTAAKDEWCHLVTQESCPEIYDFIIRSSKELGIKTPPEVILFDSNAHKEDPGSAYLSMLDGNIYLDISLIRFLENNERQVKAALGHELGHKTHSRRAFMAKAATGLASIGIDKLLKGNGYAVGPLALLGIAVINRQAEFDADHKSATIVGPENLVDLLEKCKTIDSPVGDVINALMGFAMANYQPSMQKRIKVAKQSFGLQ